MDPELRRILRDRYRTASRFDAFVLDHFPDVFQEFVSRTTRTERENILAIRVGDDAIRAVIA